MQTIRAHVDDDIWWFTHRIVDICHPCPRDNLGDEFAPVCKQVSRCLSEPNLVEFVEYLRRAVPGEQWVQTLYSLMVACCKYGITDSLLDGTTLKTGDYRAMAAGLLASSCVACGPKFVIKTALAEMAADGLLAPRTNPHSRTIAKVSPFVTQAELRKYQADCAAEAAAHVATLRDVYFAHAPKTTTRHGEPKQ